MKWGGAVVSVLLVVMWVGSAWWLFSWGYGTWNYMEVSQGRVTLRSSIHVKNYHANAANTATQQIAISKQHEADLRAQGRAETDPEIQLARTLIDQSEATLSMSRPFWEFRRSVPGFSLWWDWAIRRDDWCIQTPLWNVVVAALTLTIVAWRPLALVLYRTRIGHCPHCNYNRHGIPAQAVCPECGEAPPMTPHR